MVTAQSNAEYIFFLYFGGRYFGIIETFELIVTNLIRTN